MSLWPFSSSTSNIAFGSDCDTVASMTTAGSFWSPSASPRSGLRAFGVLVPRRGPRCLPKSFESLLGDGAEPRFEVPRELRRHALHRDEALEQGGRPARVGAHRFGDELGALVQVAGFRDRDAGPELELDVVRREALGLDTLRPCAGVVALLVELVGIRVGVVRAADRPQAAQLVQRLGVVLDTEVDDAVLPALAACRAAHDEHRRGLLPADVAALGLGGLERDHHAFG